MASPQHHLLFMLFLVLNRAISLFYYSDPSIVDLLSSCNWRDWENPLENIPDNHASSHFFMLLDSDNFTACNNNYSHATGDRALARVSTTIKDTLRLRDMLTRCGGEAFMVLMTRVNAAIIPIYLSPQAGRGNTLSFQVPGFRARYYYYGYGTNI